MKNKISFITLVCNGSKFIENWLENYYEQAHNVSICEGSTKLFAEANGFKTPESTDGTFELIQEWRKKHDKENKVKVIHSTNDFYSEKNEQVNLALSLVPKDTDYIVLSGIDELMLKSDIEKIDNLLWENKYTFVSCYQYNFWKGIDYIGVGGDGWSYSTPIPTVFKYTPNCQFTNHRPPTILLNGIDVKEIKPLNANQHNIKVRHYSYVYDKEVSEKMKYYSLVYPQLANHYKDWFENFFMKWTPKNRDGLEKIYSVHPSCDNAKTVKFEGEHPEVINKKFTFS